MRNRIAIIVLLALSAASCARQAPSTDEVPVCAALDSLRVKWNDYNRSGDYDSLIIVTRPLFDESVRKNDTLSVLYTAMTVAQAYLFTGQMDSVRTIMEYISPMRTAAVDPQLGAGLCFVEGSYAVKAELDYSKALQCYLAGYDYIENNNDVDNQIVFLSNIVHIFYMRSDVNGMEYARKAWTLSLNNEVNDAAHCMAAVAMAQMLYVSYGLEEAVRYLDYADSIANENGQLSQFAVISLLYGEIYACSDKYAEAYECYSRAAGYSRFADPGTASYIFLRLGILEEAAGHSDEAESYYRQGIQCSYENKSMEFRSDLLRRLSALYYSVGNDEAALEYYHAYGMITDSIPQEERERSFNDLLLSYRDMEHDNEIHLSEMALMEANRRVTLCIFIIVLILIVAGAMLFIIVQKNKADRRLVRQDRNWERRMDMEKAFSSRNVGENTDADREKQLYGKLGLLMERDRIYRKKDISLDMIAALVGTNRTYISKCINNIAGMTFYNYLDTYRIREAKDIIRSGSMNFKELSDFLGYSSLSVFYRVFQRETGMTPGKYRKTAASIEKDGFRTP